MMNSSKHYMYVKIHFSSFHSLSSITGASFHVIVTIIRYMLYVV